MDCFTAPEWVASVKCSHCAHMEASQILRTKLDSNKLTTSQEQLDAHTIQVVILHVKTAKKWLVAWILLYRIVFKITISNFFISSYKWLDKCSWNLECGVPEIS